MDTEQLKAASRATAGQSRRLLLSGGATLPAALAACALPSVGAQEAGNAPPAQPTGATAGGSGSTGAAAAGGSSSAGGATVGTAAAGAPATAAPEVLAATPECADDDDVTPSQTEGPYFTPNSPQRVSLLENGLRGTRLTVTGRVLTTTCQPVARALVDFWQCDDGGAYDNRGYRLRGHQFTDAQGTYKLQTIVPGLYPGRTRHIHVKVQAPNQRVLTTQLYFPGEPGNRRDGIYNADLELTMKDDSSGKVGLFDFVLRVV